MPISFTNWTRTLSCALATAALAACSEEETPPPTEEPATPTSVATPDIDAADVIASDELGGFEGPVAGVAFWNHPRLPFQGLLLVAADNKLTAYNIEDGVAVSALDGFETTGLALDYQGVGATARAIGAGFDVSENQFRFFSVADDTRQLQIRPSLMVAPSVVDGFCLGRTEDSDTLSLHVLSGDAIVSHALAVADAGVSVSQSSRRDGPEAFAACAVDSLDGAVFAVGASGDIYRYTNDTAQPPAPFASTGARQPAAAAVIFNGLVEGGSTDDCCGQIAVLDGDTGVVSVVDRDDGHALGRIAIAASYDVEAVTSASAMGLGAGNFGGAYRNGVLAIATGDTGDGSRTDVLRLAPWSGVLNALQQPVSQTSAARDLAPQSGGETANSDALTDALPPLDLEPLQQ